MQRASWACPFSLSLDLDHFVSEEVQMTNSYRISRYRRFMAVAKRFLGLVLLKREVFYFDEGIRRLKALTA